MRECCLKIFSAATSLVLVCAICLSGCGDGAGPSFRAKWTIMLYLDGDNRDIQNDLIKAFEEMVQEGAGSRGQVNVVAQFDRYPGNPAYGGWEITHRFFITKGMEPVEDNAIRDWGDGSGGREADMSSPDVLKDFIRWSVKKFPAERYALVVVSHGYGWEGLLVDDTNYHRTMTVKDFAKALRDSRTHIDLLGLDACTMQMIEVAHELRNTGTDILVGSENTGTTWPFARILNAAADSPDLSAVDFGKVIVDEYNKYHTGEKGITLSQLRLNEIGPLSEAVKEFSLAIRDESPFPLVQQKAYAVMEKIQNAVMYSRNSPDWESARGISVYFPQVGGVGIEIPLELQYFYKDQTVSFANDAFWHDLLTSCYVFSENPPPVIEKIVSIRFGMDTFDDDKVDLYDFCDRIVNFNSRETGANVISQGS